jgi:RNA polymerase sigma-70 factor (ECF subfamily)
VTPEGVAALESAARGGALDAYQPYWAARAELLAAAGDPTGARAAFERAVGLCIDPAIRRPLIMRAERLGSAGRA